LNTVSKIGLAVIAAGLSWIIGGEALTGQVPSLSLEG